MHLPLPLFLGVATLASPTLIEDLKPMTRAQYVRAYGDPHTRT
jgi:hypothetical protein